MATRHLTNYLTVSPGGGCIADYIYKKKKGPDPVNTLRVSGSVESLGNLNICPGLTFIALP